MVRIPEYIKYRLGVEADKYEQGLKMSFAEARPFVQPLSLAMVVTTSCNTKCLYCPYQNGIVQMQSRFLDLNIALEAIDEFHQFGGRFVRFSGGEPLLHRGLSILVNRAADLGLHTTLITNGLALCGKELPWLARLSALSLSIDTLDDSLARQIRGIDRSAYELILDALMKLKKRAPQTWIGANCVVSRRNVALIPELVRELSHRGIPIQFQPCHSFGDDGNTAEYPLPNDVSQLVFTLEKMRAEGFLVECSRWYLERMVDFFHGKKHKEDCSAGYLQFLIDTDATVRFCCMLEPIGTFKEGNMRSVWNSDEATQQRILIREGRCPRCWLTYMDLGK